ncbi:MAG: Hsp70 family protein [Phycisphaerales bacterium]|jgi:molecular chaperone DnaK|nr:Hsp70 family protein [Phycisphaerales bacterium]
MENNGKNVIGIDLGTTFCAMAYVDKHGTPVTMPNAEGELTTASVVLFDEDGTVTVGQRAKRTSAVHPDRVVACVKREMGEEVCREPVAGEQVSPVHVSSLILKKLRQDAEKKLGPLEGAVVTVPAYFDDARRQATVDAGQIAGLNVLAVLNEPTAAAIAYGFRGCLQDNTKPEEQDGVVGHSPESGVVIVYDLGGGTFDVSIIRIKDDEFVVLATDGDVRLGGKDWDNRIIDYAADMFASQYEADPREDPHSYQELILSAEEAKKDLSLRQSTEFTVSFGGNRLIVSLTREQFDEMTCDLLFRTENRLHRVIEDAAVEVEDLSRILLVGGSTRMPQIKSMIKRVTGAEVDDSLSADEVVAHGAAIRAAMLVATGRQATAETTPTAQAPGSTKDARLTPRAGDDDADSPAPLDEENLIFPPGVSVGSDTAPRTLDMPQDNSAWVSFSYDEDVAEVLSNATVVNVTSRSLGVVAQSQRTKEHKTSVLIPKGSKLPAKHQKVYGTVRENQNRVEVRIVEGESNNPRVCTPIGKCVVSPLPSGLPRGSRIRVTFEYDESGRLYVQAKDEASGAAAQTVIIRKNAMTQEQLGHARELVDSVVVN